MLGGLDPEPPAENLLRKTLIGIQPVDRDLALSVIFKRGEMYLRDFLIFFGPMLSDSAPDHESGIPNRSRSDTDSSLRYAPLDNR